MRDAGMDCERVQDLLSGFLERSLPESEQAGVTAHLRECLPCKATKEGLEETILLLRNLPPRKAPPDLLEGLWRRIAQENASSSRPLWKKLFLPAYVKIPLEAAAAVVLFLLVYGVQIEDLPMFFSPRPAARMDAAPAVGGGKAKAERDGEKAGEFMKPAEEKGRKAPGAPSTAAPESVAGRRPAKQGDGTPGRAARSGPDPARTTSSPPAAPRSQSSLPAVPARRVSTDGERVEPPAVVPPPSTIVRAIPLGGEVTIEVAAHQRAGMEERIAVAAMRLGGRVQRLPDPSATGAEIAADAVRVHLPGDAARPFLAELSKLGTLPEEGMSGWAELPAGPATEIAAYVVRIRVR
jgi:hypothetical protein